MRFWNLPIEPLLLLPALLACARAENSSQATAASQSAQPAPPPKPEPPKEPTLLERLQGESTLSGALQILRPKMTDAVNDVPLAGAALALWGSKHMTWADIQSLPETKRALVMKDSEAERGKRLCASGSIIEITTDRSAGSPIYTGGLMAQGYNVVRFAAVGSSGTLVAKNVARICGVVIGTYSYSNSGGGTTHAAYIVGMFDLPENKPKKAALPQ